MAIFEEEHPSRESYWRSVILFGRNSASYKFALAKSLLELAQKETTFISFEDLAVPFSKNVTEHLKQVEKQGSSSSSKFLDACRKYNNGQISSGELIQATVKLGFNN